MEDLRKGLDEQALTSEVQRQELLYVHVGQLQDRMLNQLIAV